VARPLAGAHARALEDLDRRRHAAAAGAAAHGAGLLPAGGRGNTSPLGQWAPPLFGVQLTFSFTGLLIASLVFNIPFALQPLQRAYENVPPSLHEAALVCGLSAWERFTKVDLPLVWPGIMSAAVMTFAHTLGEFGVVLMVGGSIPGETQTIAIAIYDRVQAFDTRAAHTMSLTLLLISLLAIAASLIASRRLGRPRPEATP
jgi:molybdate transport system permease protein